MQVQRNIRGGWRRLDVRKIQPFQQLAAKFRAGSLRPDSVRLVVGGQQDPSAESRIRLASERKLSKTGARRIKDDRRQSDLYCPSELCARGLRCGLLNGSEAPPGIQPCEMAPARAENQTAGTPSNSAKS